MQIRFGNAYYTKSTVSVLLYEIDVRVLEYFRDSGQIFNLFAYLKKETFNLPAEAFKRNRDSQRGNN